MARAPSLLIVRYAPWMTFRNAHPHDLMWPALLMSTAGVARREGWDVTLLDLHVEDQDPATYRARMVAARPDVVLLDSMTPTIKVAVDDARFLKETLGPDVTVLGVGQHASEGTEDVLFTGSAVDGVIRGEHEDAVAKILGGAKVHEIDGGGWWDGEKIATKGGKQEVKDLDRLPPIEPIGMSLDGYRMRSVSVPRFGRVRWGNLLTSRGCPYPCTFCSPTLRQSWGRGYRMQSAERVVDDMARLRTDWGVQAFYTIDDVFSLHKGRVRKICELLIEKDLDVHWTIQTRADLLDPDTCKLLKEAKCVAVKMGIESGVPRLIELIKKKETRESMLQAAKEVRAAGLMLTAYYMLGHPTETLDEMYETIRFAHEVDADMIQVAFHTPYPGSETWETYVGDIHDLGDLNHYETQHLNASKVDGATLEKLQRRFYLGYYFTPRIFARYMKNRMLYRSTDPEEWRLAYLALRYLVLERGQQNEDSSSLRPARNAAPAAAR